ncbi:hypothetical protein CPHO_00470 [Corynebacterium phocae]|uniref:HTH cro/C1-type domain-containing protein n=1 Tax=Corynebacterium phocae TaxID=161895 RepID=A0A1L7D0M5_9CORY|nr:HigA family addiction module antitoxin [Corynebacterium phocae]APT91654.1 hypothetical protein CPHO_00470 [Corynebacterium phocae]
MNTPISAELFPAGEILADELDARGWTQSEFAEVLGRPAQFVSEIISGKKEITRESATQIGAALGTSAEFWLNLQDSYLLWKQSHNARTRENLNDVKPVHSLPIDTLRFSPSDTKPFQQAPRDSAQYQYPLPDSATRPSEDMPARDSAIDTYLEPSRGKNLVAYDRRSRK